MPSGVYVIVNKVNNKQYVGSAIDLAQRKTVHFTKLRHNKHASRHLQAAFKKHGEDAFSFSVLETLESPDRATLLACEQKWMDMLRPAYNKRLVADSNLGIPMPESLKVHNSVAMSAWRATPDGVRHKEKLREIAKASWADPTKKAKRVEAIKATWTPEKRAEQSAVSKARFTHVVDGVHFGSFRVWTEEEKKRSGAKLKEAWKSRAPVSEDDIRKLVTDTNPAWTTVELTGLRSLDKVLIRCAEHSHEQWQTIAKLRHEHRGCKLCGYARSSEVQSGRSKSKPSPLQSEE